MQKKKVGILGTSANPLHDGHIELALSALDTIGLDEVLFMVNQNPFKDTDGYAAVEHRLHLAHLQARASGRLGNGLKVSEFEVALRALNVENATAVMLDHFSRSYPETQPVWMMGTDNFEQLHKWGAWTEIMERYPVVVFGRNQNWEASLHCVAAKQYESAKCAVDDFVSKPGTWCFIEQVNHPANSTDIRAALKCGVVPSYISDESVAYIRKYGLFGCAVAA